MGKFQFTAEEKGQVVRKVQAYFEEELDQKIGSFEAEFLIDFFAGEVGAYFYNRGLYDAQALFSLKQDEIIDSIFELEKPTEPRK